MIDIKDRKLILAFFGKSGAGKDTIAKYFVENFPKTEEIVTYTTRPKRDYEVDGKDYHFITKDEFIDKVAHNKMIEYTTFNDWYYGTAIDSIKDNIINVGVFNIQGIKNFIKANKFLICPVYVTASDKTRLLRSLNREANPDCKEIVRRFHMDENDFENINFNYNILNNEDKLPTDMELAKFWTGLFKRQEEIFII